QPRVEEHRRDAGQHERPPHPVARDAVPAHDVGDEVGRVAAEGGGDHREAGEPPWHRAARREELGRARAGALTEQQRGPEADDQAGGGDDPVERREMHGGGDYTGPTSSGATRVAVYNRTRSPRRRSAPPAPRLPHGGSRVRVSRFALLDEVEDAYLREAPRSAGRPHPGVPVI